MMEDDEEKKAKEKKDMEIIDAKELLAKIEQEKAATATGADAADKRAAAEKSAAEKKPEGLTLDLATKTAERLNAKLEEIKETEAKIDEKIANFKKFVKETEVQGVLQAGKEQTPNEKIIEGARRLVGSEGLDPFAGEGANAKPT